MSKYFLPRFVVEAFILDEENPYPSKDDIRSLTRYRLEKLKECFGNHSLAVAFIFLSDIGFKEYSKDPKIDEMNIHIHFVEISLESLKNSNNEFDIIKKLMVEGIRILIFNNSEEYYEELFKNGDGNIYVDSVSKKIRDSELNV